MESEAEVTQQKTMQKSATLSENLDKKSKKTQKMIGQMSVNVIRYEMFLKGNTLASTEQGPLLNSSKLI